MHQQSEDVEHHGKYHEPQHQAESECDVGSWRFPPDVRRQQVELVAHHHRRSQKQQADEGEQTDEYAVDVQFNSKVLGTN